MIPLLAYTLVHSGISRISSLVFYMEKFRLSRVLRPEHRLVPIRVLLLLQKKRLMGLHLALHLLL